MVLFLSIKNSSVSAIRKAAFAVLFRCSIAYFAHNQGMAEL